MSAVIDSDVLIDCLAGIGPAADEVDSHRDPSIHDWHFDVLAKRERRLASGEARLIPLNEFLDKMHQTMP